MVQKIGVEESQYNENVDKVKQFVQSGYSKHILNQQKIKQDFLHLLKQVFRTKVLIVWKDNLVEIRIQMLEVGDLHDVAVVTLGDTFLKER